MSRAPVLVLAPGDDLPTIPRVGRHVSLTSALLSIDVLNQSGSTGMRNVFINLAIALSFVQCQAMAKESVTAGELYTFCAKAEQVIKKQNISDREFADASYCFGLFKGLSTILIAGCQFYKRGRMSTNMLAADIYSIEASIKVFMKWLDDNPKFYGEDEAIAARSLIQEFPCVR